MRELMKLLLLHHSSSPHHGMVNNDRKHFAPATL